MTLIINAITSVVRLHVNIMYFMWLNKTKTLLDLKNTKLVYSHPAAYHTCVYTIVYMVYMTCHICWGFQTQCIELVSNAH